jgi:hypothetical protein
MHFDLGPSYVLLFIIFSILFSFTMRLELRLQHELTMLTSLAVKDWTELCGCHISREVPCLLLLKREEIGLWNFSRHLNTKGRMECASPQDNGGEVMCPRVSHTHNRVIDSFCCVVVVICNSFYSKTGTVKCFHLHDLTSLHLPPVPVAA